MKHFFQHTLYIFWFVFCIGVALPLFADAAMITTRTDTTTPGIVVVDVFIDPEGESLNTFAGTLEYPTDMVLLESISTIDSVVGLWVDRPNEAERGSISWSGLTPGGFRGVQSPFTNSSASGKLFQMVFRTVETGPVGMNFSSIEVRKHDGAGSLAVTTAHPVSFTAGTVPENVTVPVAISANSDSVTFTAEVIRDERVADNKWIAVFAVDTNRVSVDHYEVAESLYKDSAAIASRKWKRAESPYILAHQSRRHTVHVKAVATDGQIYTTTVAPLPREYSTTGNILLWSILGVLVIVFFAIKRYTRF